MHALCSILTIHGQDKITNLEVLDETKTKSIEAMLLKAQLHWTGQVTRMGEQNMQTICYIWRAGVRQMN